MGVYIKGMKMPKNCIECEIRAFDANAGEEYCPFSQMECISIGLQKNCPLVEVPEPHGRLIESPDISEYEVFDEDTGTREISLLGLMECHRMVKDAPTVIEAEGE